ncbi:MAG: SdrD B-like domain-containing protein [Candidatus Andersenbacteria bacterium]
MALDQGQRKSVRVTLYSLLTVGIVVGVLLFFFGDDALGLAKTFLGRSRPVTSTVHLKVFNDADMDGIQNSLDAREHLVAYSDVLLKGERELRGTTSASGELTLTEVPSGMYQLSAVLTGNALALTPSTLTVGNSANQEISLAAHSDIPLSGVDGRLLLDTNGDGIANDAGLAGIEMQVRSNDAIVTQAKTDQDGNFTFNALAAGTYTLIPILTGVQLTEYRVESAPRAEIEIRSTLDRVQQQLLIKVRPASDSL